MKIGKKIQQLRKEKEMTQRDLANRLNVSPQAISRWENDEVEPSIETLSQMSEIFSVSLDELFGRATQRPDDEKSNTTAEPRSFLRRSSTSPVQPSTPGQGTRPPISSRPVSRPSTE